MNIRQKIPPGNISNLNIRVGGSVPGRLRSCRYLFPLLLFSSLVVLTRSPAQTSETRVATPNSSIPKSDAPEFKVRIGTNLVVVRVAVHDREGRAVENLTKEHFRILDNGKEQTIVQFEPEPPPNPTVPAETSSSNRLPDNANSANTSPTAEIVPVSSPRFLALYFDDFDMSPADVTYARDAADRYLAKNLRPTDRAAIVTASGSIALEFTADLKQLHETLLKLMPSSRFQNHDCPEITDYQADEMLNREGNYLPGPPPGRNSSAPVPPPATNLAITEAINHCHMQSMSPDDLLSFVRSAARTVLDRSRMQAQYALEGFDQLVKYISMMPGQRNIVLVSTGFLSTEQEFRIAGIIDRALRSQVTISSIDAKGLAVRTREADASQAYLPKEGNVAGTQHQLDSERELHATAVLQELADGTGGKYFHNNNDLDAGFREAAIAFEPGYILAFSPSNMKFDGKFHTIKVNLLQQPHGLAVQARKGYFAPRTPPDPDAEEKRQIQDAILSTAEFAGLPVALKTRTSKSANTTELLVWAHLDVAPLRFRKQGQHSLNALTFVSAIFSKDGKPIGGQEKHLQLDLEDAALRQLLASGIDVTLTFHLPPGEYIVREVVSDSEDHRLTAISRKLEIP